MGIQSHIMDVYQSGLDSDEICLGNPPITKTTTNSIFHMFIWLCFSLKKIYIYYASSHFFMHKINSKRFNQNNHMNSHFLLHYPQKFNMYHCFFIGQKNGQYFKCCCCYFSSSSSKNPLHTIYFFSC